MDCKNGATIFSEPLSASCLTAWTGYRAGGYRISGSDSLES